jgi:hypothetical protein
MLKLRFKSVLQFRIQHIEMRLLMLHVTTFLLFAPAFSLAIRKLKQTRIFLDIGKATGGEKQDRYSISIRDRDCSLHHRIQRSCLSHGHSFIMHGFTTGCCPLNTAAGTCSCRTESVECLG